MKYSAPAAWAIVASLLLAVPAQAAGLTETTGQPAASSITTLSPAALASLNKTAATAQPQTGTTATPEGRSFFKTKKGAAALVLIGAGFGYALYSQQHDRVLSAIRQ
jgi:hypothetical protein